MSVKEKSGQSTSWKHNTAWPDMPHSIKSDKRVSPLVRIRRSTGGAPGFRSSNAGSSPDVVSIEP
jgi:hypothetical protein